MRPLWRIPFSVFPTGFMRQALQQVHNTFAGLLPRMPASITRISRRWLTSNPQIRALSGMSSVVSRFFFLGLSVSSLAFHPSCLVSRFHLRSVFVNSVSFFISDFSIISCRIIVVFIFDFWSFIFVSHFVFSTESPGSSLSFPSRFISRLFWSPFSSSLDPHGNICPRPPSI